MSRPREFNEDRVLDSIMDTFWKSGYEQTSAQDLVEATKLGRGSLYGAYGSKEKLFKLALTRYKNHSRACAEKLNQKLPVKKCLYDLLHEIALSEIEVSPKRGCLVTNTAVEFSGQNSEINELVRTNLRILKQGIYHALLRGQENGEIDSKLNIIQISLYILSSIQGLRVMAKISTSEDTADLLSLIDNILSVIFKDKNP
ncbi:TetR/AcrR family transcriptional regulator [Alteromonas sp. 5E99-2]|uniref:TetR/AcrR family transcriptional regulator n=1 Tax=Alteromonas sp. 5E99-2 TaxID=2817683 RepID=UPI001A99F805|nr:TetR/AcrR family transcriptional regulator [Alteromonas sp. 5E99-2]MBO1255459.1 TetR/AcrR family transcriptional regulator [Alteromonas sp. 5E99-2]